MSQPKTVSVPATAESVGDILYIWDDGDRVQLDDHHYRILAFVGKYTTLSNSPHGKCDHCNPLPWPHVTHPVDLLPHFAQGTLTFDSEKEKRLAEGDKGTFTVKKTKDKDETEYDVEVDITYLHKEHGSLIKENAVVGFASYRLNFTLCSSVSLDLF